MGTIPREKASKKKAFKDKGTLRDSLTITKRNKEGKIKHHHTTDVEELSIDNTRNDDIEVTISSTDSENDNVLHSLFGAVKRRNKQ